MAVTAGTKQARQFQDLFEVIPFTADVDPAAFVDDESQVVQITVPGAEIGDFVLVAPGVDLTEATFSAFVQAADTVDIVLSMTGGDTNNVASSVWNGIVLKPKTDFATR